MSYGWLWPGLPQMWAEGRWSGLFWAAGFAIAVELLLLSVWVWDEMLGSAGLWGMVLVVAGSWVVGIIRNRRRLSRRRPDADRKTAEDLFPNALAEYLQGNWFLAEQHCRDLIRRRRDDVDARLLLATLLRHIDRRTEARAELDALAKFDGAAKWGLEIAHERLRLDEMEHETTVETPIPNEEMIRRAA